ncbi:MAG: isocitrate/isopropylmalate dehydrogenase family protein [Candidatus Coatesbacteria bacterium]|nr:isocitrate/isopropylmalate dehydrogenase family protein [Candidatus Coatesbacteria bacterium]
MGYKIARIPGDDVGHDVMKAAMIIMDALELDIDWVDADAGWCMWEAKGNTVPPETWDVLESTDACLFGAITSRPGVKGFKSAILQIRQRMDLYTNMRPIKAIPGVPLNYRDNIDMVIFRENTEGLYSMVEARPLPKELIGILPNLERFADEEETAISCRVFTRKGCERIIRSAFDYAKQFDRKKVTAVHKANVIRQTDGLFLEIFNEVAKEFPGLETNEENVDATAMWFIKNPEAYDVLVTSNMFGDIISDEGCQLVGGLGFGASGNIGADYGVFEPNHGSAPKYAGQFVVNPTAMFLAARIMLQWLGEHEAAGRIWKAVTALYADAQAPKTYDIVGRDKAAGTLKVAEAVAERL